MKQTTSLRAATRPAKHAAPKPRRGSDTTIAPSARGDLRGAVGGAVVDDDRPVAGGHAPEHPRQRGGLVEDWEDDVDHDAVTLAAAPYESGNTGPVGVSSAPSHP